MKLRCFLPFLISLLSFVGVVDAQELHEAKSLLCEFVAKETVGKSSEAVCAQYSEYAFSTNFRQHAQSEHCRTVSMSEATAWTNFQVDLLLNLVWWEDDIIGTAQRREEMIVYSMQEFGISRADAETRYADTSRAKAMKILNVDRATQNVFLDPVTGEYLDEILRAPSLIVRFGEPGQSYTLFVDGSSFEAIVSSYESSGRNAWVREKFGSCKVSK